MNNFPNDLIKYDLNKFLTLDEKLIIRRVNKKFNNIQKKNNLFSYWRNFKKKNWYK